MNVLLATDLSEAGLGSVHGLLACGCAGFDTVTLLHVIDLDLYTAGGSVPQLQAWAATELEKAAADLRENGFTVGVRVEVGPTVESIRRVAEETRADLVVATNLGRNAVVGRLLGSIAERLPLATRLPVLIERVGHDGERWCRMGSASPFSRVLLAVDPAEDDPTALLRSVLRFPGVQSVTLSYVAPDEAARETAETKLQSVVDAVAPGVAVQVAVVVGQQPADRLLAEARTLDSTVIAVGACRHGMLHREVLGSVARKVAVEAEHAVLLMPPE
jgi:nucleotide-binding universal stress UspA family protein